MPGSSRRLATPAYLAGKHASQNPVFAGDDASHSVNQGVPASIPAQPGASLLIYGARVFSAGAFLDDGWVLADDGIIVAVGQGSPRPSAAIAVDARRRLVVPGFIDLHTHGGNGADFSDGTIEAFAVATQFHARHGVTALQATTTAVPINEIRRALDAARVWTAEPRPGTSTVLGVHVEGPYISVAQRGCQPAQNILEPQPADIDFLLSYSDVVTEVTLAPELPGAIEMVRGLAQAHKLVSAGHSNAYEEQVRAAVEAGLRHVTHIYSAMSSMRREGPYRRAGLLEVALTHPGLTTEMIADGRHLPATLMRLVLACKGVEQVCLVSDAMRGAGLPEGQRLTIAGVEAVIEDGVAIMADRTGFAGSITPLDQMLRNVVWMLELPLASALTMVTRTPAAVLGIDDHKGAIAPGMDADLAVLNTDLNVEQTIIGGQIVYDARVGSGAL